METSLDVLSFAASMVVETDESNGKANSGSDGKGDATIRNELRSDSPKELPTRLNRHRRSTERRELTQALKFDDSHFKGSVSNMCNTRCMGTQTVISTMKLDLPVGNDVSSIPEVSATALITPMLPTWTPPPLYHPPSDQPKQLRPSVIAVAPPQHREESGRTYLRKNGLVTTSNGSLRREITSGGCDPSIEEHFRRSLGKDYNNAITSPSTSPDLTKNLLITGSVDDHFAKALGDKWNQIKDTVDMTTKSSPPSSPKLMTQQPLVSS
ncbi:transcription cofactor vestigial-like protein 4 isoform X1 [Anneissia japonica]|uniref:transcription cofactor vestigial-like protein 4 isoform X1 n=1 Tax=Anneissia japonica TaxID=1529436 RepID=UPI001425834B|nr:transcription cofactor vestigial-like protein 4 isoform X1 [Anneissia japonica]